MLSADALEVADIARSAGAVILARYGRRSLLVQDKDDGSPVTDADLAADALIRDRLSARWPHPIVSEESPPPPPAERQAWSRFWLVDPLDGTRDFVASTGEFCVCIALIEAGRPIIGVLSAPVLGLTWIAERGRGAWRVVHEVGAVPVRLHAEPPSGPLRAFKSRFHHLPRAETFVRALGVTELVDMGSAIKFARLAEGAADVFVSFSSAKLWDLAAGQLVVEEAGGRVWALPRPGEMGYQSPRHDGPTLAAGDYVVLGPRLPDDTLKRIENRAS